MGDAKLGVATLTVGKMGVAPALRRPQIQMLLARALLA